MYVFYDKAPLNIYLNELQKPVRPGKSPQMEFI